MRLPALAVAFVLGVLLGPKLGSSPAALALFLLAAALTVPLALSLRWRTVPVFMLLALAAGMLRAGTVEPEPAAALAQFHRASDLQVEGVVLDEPDALGQVYRLRLEVERVGGDPWIRVQGTVLVTLRETVDIVDARDRPFFRYGDRLLLTGALEPPPDLDDFDYPAYLGRQGIGTVMSFPDVVLLNAGEGAAFRRWLQGARRSLAQSLVRVVPEPQASFGQAVLLGVRDGLPDDLVEDFRVSGTSHILAISGLHISVLLGISLSVSALAVGRRRQLYLVVPLILVWGYALISGAPPSAVRAAIMGTAYLGALAVGRPRSTLPALALAAAIMVAIEPAVLSSVSFQLSFAAMAGIALLNRPLAEWIESAVGATPDRDGLWPSLMRLVIELATVSFAATVAVLPLVAFYFERVSLVGLPGAAIETGRLAPALVWVYYIALTAALFVRPAVKAASRQGPPSRLLRPMRSLPSAPWLVVALVITLASLTWTAVLTDQPGMLRVVFADIGQGDMALITTPGGHRIVVDGGPNGATAAGALGSELTFWERSIDLVVLTHPHSDHVAGLTELLNRYNVRRVLQREINLDTAQHVEWTRSVASEGALVLNARPGQVLSFDDGVIVEVIAPPEPLLNGTESDTDNASVVLRVSLGEVSFLLAADIFSEGEASIIRGGLNVDADVLKVPHHGSRNASTAAFLAAVSPAAAVISAGTENRFGHPHQELLDRLARHLPPDRVYVTSERGTVTFVTDGKTLSVTTER